MSNEEYPKIKKHIKKLRKMSMKRFGLTKKDLKCGISFGLDSTRTLGKFRPGGNGVKRTFIFNKKIVDMAGEKKYLEIVTHEYAHLLTRVLMGRKRVQPHGYEWKSAMRSLGETDPRATTPNFIKELHAVNPKGRVEVSCGCGFKSVTNIIAKRMREGTNYTCGSCKQRLKEV